MKTVDLSDQTRLLGEMRFSNDKCVRSFFYKVMSCHAEVGHWFWVTDFAGRSV